MKLRRIMYIALSAILLIIAIAAACDIAVTLNARGRTYSNADDIPHRRTALVLGTRPTRADGSPSTTFMKRMDAAAALYKAGKADRLIVSGGDATYKGEYNEPIAMRDSLIARGIPAEAITIDEQGQRTLKSIANIRNIFHTDSVIIVSQAYHNQRSLYQADHLGINAIAFNAEDTPSLFYRVKNRAREVLARTRLFLDLYLTK